MRAIFLDRDGVINVNRVDHVTCWKEFVFLPGALSALRALHLAGFHVFVVTNQAIVSRGMASRQDIEHIHERMALQVALHGGHIHDIRYCPHDRGDACDCRKPEPGMLRALAARWQFDPRQACMVGDAWTDIAAGQAVGCRTIMVRTGRGAEQIAQPEAHRHPADHIAADLAGAVDWLFQQEGLISPAIEENPRLRRAVLAHRAAALPMAG